MYGIVIISNFAFAAGQIASAAYSRNSHENRSQHAVEIIHFQTEVAVDFDPRCVIGRDGQLGPITHLGSIGGLL